MCMSKHLGMSYGTVFSPRKGPQPRPVTPKTPACTGCLRSPKRVNCSHILCVQPFMANQKVTFTTLFPIFIWHDHGMEINNLQIVIYVKYTVTSKSYKVSNILLITLIKPIEIETIILRPSLLWVIRHPTSNLCIYLLIDICTAIRN